MKKYLSNDDFFMEAENDEYITIKQIKDGIKALETLGKKVINIFTKINLDGEGNEQLTENDWKRITNYYNFEGLETKIINNNYILYDDKYKIKVNIDDSFVDLEENYIIYIKSAITRLTIKFE